MRRLLYAKCLMTIISERYGFPTFADPWYYWCFFHDGRIIKEVAETQKHIARGYQSFGPTYRMYWEKV